MMWATGRGRAFTFVELILVVALIAVLATLSIPQFRKTADNFALDSFSKDIYYLCRYLQAEAIAQSVVLCLRFSLERDGLQAAYLDKPLTGRYGKVYKFPAGVEAIILPNNEGGIYFYPDGSTDEVTITFKNRHERQVTLVMQGAAGEIKMQ